MSKLTAEYLVEDYTAEEKAILQRVEDVLPVLAERAAKMDHEGYLDPANVKTLSDAGLLGLVVPEAYGGLGGDLRVWAGACFAIGTVCPSTALAYFFHLTSASRGNLSLQALEAGLFNQEEAPVVQAFAEKVLTTMGRDGRWLGNFASESVKSEGAAITITTKASKVDGGWELNGVKSFGCATGIADQYLVAASLDGIDDASGLCTFIVDRDAPGTRGRIDWDALGMRGTATEGLVLEAVFVPEENALAIPGSFARMCSQSRSGYVGNQVAASSIYLAGAFAVYQSAMKNMRERKFEDTGKPLGTGPYQQQLIGEMYADLNTAMLWARRMIDIETAEPPLMPKAEVMPFWRTCKGQVAEHSFKVTQHALKLAGTSGTLFTTPFSRALRDVAMGLVQAFPAERGRLESAKMLMEEGEQLSFGALKK
ncbi:MAG: acyl-CoA dehydrogenase family protein [Halieaceae bacterium]